MARIRRCAWQRGLAPVPGGGVARSELLDDTRVVDFIRAGTVDVRSIPELRDLERVKTSRTWSDSGLDLATSLPAVETLVVFTWPHPPPFAMSAGRLRLGRTGSEMSLHTLVINLPTSIGSLDDVPHVFEALQKLRTLEHVVINFTNPLGADDSDSENWWPRLAARDVASLCGYIQKMFHIHRQVTSASFVDAHLLSAEGHSSLANFLPAEDRHRVACDNECAGGRCDALKSYTDCIWEQMQSGGSEVEGAPLENPFSFRSGDEYHLSIGNEMFNLYTDGKFHLG